MIFRRSPFGPRGRRYLPEGNGINGTEPAPDCDPQGFFIQGVKHHISVIKKDRDLFMRCMFTRPAHCRNFQIGIPRKLPDESPNRKPATNNR